MDQQAAMLGDSALLEKRPGVLVVGAPNVGKRTLLSRLLSIDLEETSDTSSGLLAYGWSINTKYYTADVSVWLANLRVGALPKFDQLAALVMVFDTSDLSTFLELKDWVSRTDIQKFDILLCIGNKVDLLPGHSAHVKQTCLEWCIEHNIEYVEACASNVEFDKCLSVDGDSQGVERLQGALSAYMWPGMVLKSSGDKILEPSLPQDQDESDEESEYELEYEILSAGSVEPWEDAGGDWVSAESSKQKESGCEGNGETRLINGEDDEPLKWESRLLGTVGEDGSEGDKGTAYKLEDLEQLMGEIGNVRDSLRLMPDFQRREMAASLAMKMAAMFGDINGDEEED